ncbi:hypothetical protein RB623_22255 [Mesorhizobium sp. LHD-90]|uniref:hypothetical protein n=1 Tax=Mesorhizobium sp. LHD-90 TaxID=3071414 RepID=UPI0027E0EFD3|nr:hypothetical protein [Mesorhizobium sp. LHD-90]MDQ6436783.1 hypothetical protein [Mesorhizobium sp. LHD-90]
MQASLGGQVRTQGYVAQLDGLCGRDTRDLEQVLGYGEGRLAGGYTLLLLADVVGPGEFEFRGMTHFPGGVPVGESRTTDASLKASLSQVAADRGRFDTMKANEARRIFVSTGPKRIAKIMPLRPGSDYPAGKGIAQWEIMVPKLFFVACKVGAGERIYRRPNDTIYAAARLESYR